MDYSEFSSLAHVPLRSSNDYYTLTDILSNGMTIDGSHVNILAVIRSVSTKMHVGFSNVFTCIVCCI